MLNKKSYNVRRIRMKENTLALRLHLQTLFNALAFLLFLSNTPMSLSFALMGNPEAIAPLRANLVIIFLLGSFALEFVSLLYYSWIIIKNKANEHVDKYQLVAMLSLILLFISMTILNVLPNALF